MADISNLSGKELRRYHKSILTFSDVTLGQVEILMTNPKYETEIDWENQYIFYYPIND